MENKLHLFTDNFPFGNGESFLNNEIPYLINEFDIVNVLPYKHNGDLTAVFKAGYKIKFIENNLPYKMSFSDSFQLLKILCLEFYNVNNKLYFLKKLRFFAAYIREALSISNYIENSEYFENSDVYYSYWMNINALALAILKDRRVINKFFFRVNGWDVYDERHEGGFLPFRNYIYKNTDKVVCVSKAAMNYIKAKNIYPEKIEYSYFGTEDYGSKTLNDKKELVLFSCSSIIPLKRVDKIVDILKNVSIPVLWVHHGSGDSQSKLLDKVKELPNNIVFKHSSYLPKYHDVLMLEKELSPDLFISLSETEGLPVTMMEAISMGIPIIATDVGGCNEIVNEETGFLIPKDIDVIEVADIIINFRDSNKSTQEFSKNVRKYWEENFQAKVNYKKFSSSINNYFK